ncbi:hypothetical protein DLF23_22240 [Salmonella enterica subsp. enterica serovar Newport]|nr:hypothetical protein [Salmonella enterica subsp. enterica serovar Newport]
MSNSKIFYAVVEHGSLACVSVLHERYEEVKAVFPDKQKAQKLVDKYQDEKLRIIELHITKV